MQRKYNQFANSIIAVIVNIRFGQLLVCPVRVPQANMYRNSNND